MKVRFTPSARTQFLTALAYIRRDDPEAARDFRRRSDPAASLIGASGLDWRQMQRPPSTSRQVPVIIEASSEARKSAALAMSSGVFSRPSGMVAT